MLTIISSIIKKPLLVYAVITAISFVAIWQIKEYAQFETNLDRYMPEHHPAFIYSDQAEDWFYIKDGIIIAIEHPDGVFNPGTIKKVDEITLRLQRMPEINRGDVQSLSTAENIVGEEYGLEVKSFYRQVPQTDEELDALARSVRSNEMIYGRIVSTSETVTIVIAELEDDAFTQELYHRILDLAEEYRGPENIYVAGRPVVEGTLAYLMPKDMSKMIPIVIFAIIAILYLTLRSMKATVITMFVVLISTIWTFGLMTLLRVPIYSVSTLIPVMLIAIGVAYGIHLFNNLYLYIRENPEADKISAIRHMLINMWKPVAMSATTTILAFITLLTSQVYPVKYFGVFTATGVASAFILSMIFLPSSIYLFNLPRVKLRKGHEKDSQWGRNTALRILKHKYLIFIATSVILVVSVIGIARVWIDSSFLRNFERDSEIVMADDFINKHFGGTTILNVIFEGDTDKFKDPDIWEKISALQSNLEELPNVGNTFSLGDYLKRMHKVMHADSTDYYRIPESDELIAQYLLLYSMSGDPENLDKVVDYDYRRTNIQVQLKGDNSRLINKVISLIEEEKDLFKDADVEINYAGSAYKGLVFTGLILEGQVASIFLSVLMVIVLLAIMFRHFSAGLIGSVPIIITVMISFGIMGLFGIPLSTTTALISSIAVGIGIDYAIHFLSRYKHSAQQYKEVTDIAIASMGHTGRAIAFNALVLIGGFMVLFFSVFPPNRELGGLLSLNMFTAFAGTLSILLLILQLVKPGFIHKSVKNINKGE
jgi:uncharacterized protein